jgi:hypothetical protein
MVIFSCGMNKIKPHLEARYVKEVCILNCKPTKLYPDCMPSNLRLSSYNISTPHSTHRLLLITPLNPSNPTNPLGRIKLNSWLRRPQRSRIIHNTLLHHLTPLKTRSIPIQRRSTIRAKVTRDFIPTVCGF